jgi:hypothetical protein
MDETLNGLLLGAWGWSAIGAIARWADGSWLSPDLDAWNAYPKLAGGGGSLSTSPSVRSAHQLIGAIE